MNAKQLGLEAVLRELLRSERLCHLSSTAISAFWELIFANSATIAALVDLSIALSLILWWMYKDAKIQGISLVPYVLLTLTLGSVGPLLYLIRRFGTEPNLLAHPQTARL